MIIVYIGMKRTIYVYSVNKLIDWKCSVLLFLHHSFVAYVAMSSTNRQMVEDLRNLMFGEA